MKIITWNVNGLRAILKKKKGDEYVLDALISENDPDIICLQETKCPADLNITIPNYKFIKILASQTKKGYSGVAIFSKEDPINILDDFPHNEEGRVIVLEFQKYYVINTYTPNSKPDLSRLEYRITVWEKSIREYINKIRKPIIFVSDFNVAPTEIDIHNPKSNQNTHGFTIQERQAFGLLLKECNLVDTYRIMNPTKQEYTWFSHFAKSRENNKGWRIDTILVSKKLANHIKDIKILDTYYASDHLPVIAEIDI
jgi:exodeoxyribonuclease-3